MRFAAVHESASGTERTNDTGGCPLSGEADMASAA